jgi:hypothetical protein
VTRPRVFTPAGWVVILSILMACIALMMTWTGCDSPSAQPLPIPSTVKPASAPKPVVVLNPGDVPENAIRYRKTLIRAWQTYFFLEEPAWIGASQIHTESRWKPTARSPVGASGLAQAMPSTADWLAEMLPADVQIACGTGAGCPLEPAWAITMLALYDYRLWSSSGRYAATKDDRWAFALAFYNGGEGWSNKERVVCQQKPGCDSTRWWGNVENWCVRSPAACRENRAYPGHVLFEFRPLYEGWLGA